MSDQMWAVLWMLSNTMPEGGRPQKTQWQQMMCTLTKARICSLATVYCTMCKQYVLLEKNPDRMNASAFNSLNETSQWQKPVQSIQKIKESRVKHTVPAASLLYIRTKGQPIQTILPLHHAVQWRLCLSHVPPDNVPSSPDIWQPSPCCFLPITGKKAGSVARWCVTTKVDVALLRCHMPPDGKKNTSPGWTPTVRLM